MRADVAGGHDAMSRLVRGECFPVRVCLLFSNSSQPRYAAQRSLSSKHPSLQSSSSAFLWWRCTPVICIEAKRSSRRQGRGRFFELSLTITCEMIFSAAHSTASQYPMWVDISVLVQMGARVRLFTYGMPGTDFLRSDECAAA